MFSYKNTLVVIDLLFNIDFSTVPIFFFLLDTKILYQEDLIYVS